MDVKKVGPTKQGVQDLIDGDPNSQWDITAKLPESGDYTFLDDTWMNSPRVIRTAIYDPSIPMESSSGGHGTHTYIQPGYNLAGFWIEDIGAQGTITGRFIPGAAFGSSSGPTPGNTGIEPKKIVLVE